MKLISVKILGNDFRSLASNKLYKFNVNSRIDRLSSKIFAGLNGSGKSNFLELLAEIFFHLEKYHMNTVSPSEKRTENIGFEIEYHLPFSLDEFMSYFSDDLGFYFRNPFGHGERIGTYNTPPSDPDEEMAIVSNEYEKQSNLFYKNYNDSGNASIKITRPVNSLPEFSIYNFSKEHFETISTNTHNLLPTKIIAYTSGQNELLSNPFYKIRYHYFKELEKENTSAPEGKMVNDRLFFLDSSSNFSIFVSNMLLANPQKLKYLKEVFNVDDLHSFRITINLVDYRKRKISLSKTTKTNIDKLKLCATSWIDRKKGKDEFLILDYNVNEATHQAFKFHFKTSFELFKAFYDLDNLNLYMVPVDTRGLILKAHKSLNISDELPQPDPSKLIFRIEKININKIVAEDKPSKTIYYKGLSDGEHQFNEVIGSVLMMEQEGCLFLMDEPDTHFNPQWRGKMIEMLNYVAASSYDDKGRPETVRKQEIIITTHSPFVISDSLREDVYKFDKLNGEVVYMNPEIETYGTSVSLLLQEIFDRRISISDLSNFDLDEFRLALKELNDPETRKAKIEETKAKLVYFGESIEKFDLYSLLRQIENEIGGKK